jgi:phosphoribosylformimino-5-aminoimidazole carboxamide ribotide isomerase
MKIYPAIDLINGHCVRLTKGDFNTQEVFANDAVALAQAYERSGSQYLHIVDLDGAKTGRLSHLPLIKNIAQNTRLNIQVGGGLRTLEDAQKLIEIGAEKIVIGSLAVKDQNATVEIIHKLGPSRITLAIDVKPIEQSFFIATSGWQETSKISPESLIDFYGEQGVTSFLCTDISRDGMMQGPSFDLYQSLCQRFQAMEIQASGGIRHKQDLSTLKACGAGGAIIGKALYLKTISIEDALTC